MSKILSLPENFMTLLGKMHGVFTEPPFFYFTEFIKGILISPRKAVTRFYLFGDRERHFTDYHRFLNHFQWDPQNLALSILKGVIETFKITHPVFLHHRLRTKR